MLNKRKKIANTTNIMDVLANSIYNKIIKIINMEKNSMINLNKASIALLINLLSEYIFLINSEEFLLKKRCKNYIYIF